MWQNHFYVNNKDTIELSVYFWIDFTQHNKFLKFLFAFWTRFCQWTLRQKQASGVFYKKIYSWKFRKIQKKVPVPKSLFLIKLLRSALLKKRLWHSRLLVNFAKFLRPAIILNPSDGCFCIKINLVYSKHISKIKSWLFESWLKLNSPKYFVCTLSFLLFGLFSTSFSRMNQYSSIPVGCIFSESLMQIVCWQGHSRSLSYTPFNTLKRKKISPFCRLIFAQSWSR